MTNAAYVVSQNDFPAAVFSSWPKAEKFIQRQPKHDINRRPIYWRVSKFTIDEGEPQ